MEAQNQILHCFLTEDFYAEVEKKLKMVNPNEYAIVSIDFDNFKYVNELFGYEFGDMVLNSVTEHFSRYLQGDEIFTRINADNFVFFIKTSINQSVIEYFLNMVNYQMSMLSILPKHYTVVTSGGICTIKNPNETISSLIDKANFARKLAKGKHTSNFLYYTDEMADELSWKKEITLSMEAALENNEFEMYLQPKILMKNNSVIGAEALVRWNSKKNGLIYPDRFIPVLEQNGFIKQIDFFMLEQVCKFLRKCIVDDMPVLPISVNFSKVHMATENLPEKIFEVVSNNHVFPEFIEIELTESVFANDYHQLIDIATRLKSLGFKVSLDDFGSAYSSLSYLKDFPVDVIKIDKGFIDEASNTEKGRLIIEKTIDMIKSLDIVPVMEGIEDSSQAEFIKRLNCDIGQGFFYAKAMPVSEFEIFVKNNLKIVMKDKKASIQKEWDNNLVEEIENYKNNSIITTDIQKTLNSKINELELLYSTIPGGVVQCLADENLTLIYSNSGFSDLTGYNNDDLKELLDNKLINIIFPDDRAYVMFCIAEQIRLRKAEKIEFRIKHKNGNVIWVLEQGQVIKRAMGNTILCATLIDVTSEKESREALRLSEERYKIIVEQSDDIMFEWDFTTDTMSFSDKYEKVLGYKPLVEKISRNEYVFRNIHPYDRIIFENWIKNTYKQVNTERFEFRLRTVNDDYLWMKVYATTICDENGIPIKAIGTFVNIDSQKSTINYFKIKSQQDSLTKLTNKEETERQIKEYLEDCSASELCAMLVIDVDDFKEINDNYGHQVGDDVLYEISSKIRNMFSDTQIVGRIGGDEFAVLMCEIQDENQIREKAKELLEAFKNTFLHGNKELKLTVSIGVAIFPTQGKTFDELYNLADIALYKSKKSGKGRYCISSK